MAKRRARRAGRSETGGNGRAAARRRETVTETVDGGLASLVPDPDRPDSWELVVEGAAQSHVDLADPTRLVFEYQRRLGHVVDLVAPPGRPVRVLHLGGGALTMARYVAVTRPRSEQQVAEPDTRLTDLVRRRLPLPRGSRIRVRAADARAVLGRFPEGWAELVIGDVFVHAQTPAHCTSGEFLDEVRRVLAPGGWYAANLTDGAALGHLRRQAATALSRFTHACLMVEPGVLRGRRFGNGILLAADRATPVAELTRRCAGDPFPARVVAGRDLTDFVAGAPVVTDATATPSPPPPASVFR